jgi:hypothetical protein
VAPVRSATRTSAEAISNPPAQTSERFGAPSACAMARVNNPPATDPRIPPAANNGNSRLAWRVSVTAPATPHT